MISPSNTKVKGYTAMLTRVHPDIPSVTARWWGGDIPFCAKNQPQFLSRGLRIIAMRRERSFLVLAAWPFRTTHMRYCQSDTGY